MCEIRKTPQQSDTHTCEHNIQTSSAPGPPPYTPDDLLDIMIGILQHTKQHSLPVLKANQLQRSLLLRDHDEIWELAVFWAAYTQARQSDSGMGVAGLLKLLKRLQAKQVPFQGFVGQLTAALRGEVRQ
ncbi:hypothetical protein SS50377_20514 [Spironucleus salmonicida]|uniref:Uncharacterized protein n=1 Tax=Spironucleus salmonicida TaxID=348837 RepID=V6LHN0_9EUKA|nr:hypothetical protein SS50377_20514 [Spironucleus salmonicida]|eukprot:EST43808.1 Hypothetical protein SS50377_16426 [Spironucleus salmonicida]